MVIQRQAIDNPLALHPKENVPVRQLSLSNVQNPMQTAGNGESQRMQEFFGVMNKLRGTVAEISDTENERMRTEGKLAYMSGATEADMAAQGNRYSMQGWQSLSAVDQANTLYLKELSDLEKMQHLTPQEYQKQLMQRRSEYLKNLPEDPTVRKMFAAAFEDVGPRLAGQHMQAHTKWNEGEMERSFIGALSSGSVANADSTRTIPGNTSLRLSDSVVDHVYHSQSADERDIAIKTMLGEAGGEGELGLAAVAHVLKNRTLDTRWGGSIKSVALAPKQFSTWNSGAGGNNPSRYKPGTPLYEKAGRVYDAVMSGKHVDPTGGATHYYSPRGMQKLVADGDQNNLIPRWLENEKKRSGGEVRIGGHIFVGRASGSVVERRPLGPATGGDISAATAAGRPMVAEDEVGIQEAERQMAIQDGQIWNRGTNVNEDLTVEPGVPAGDVAEAQAIPVEPSARPQTQVQELIRGFEGLSPARKAAALSDAIRRQLEDGDDTLFNDAGGYAMLNELGASPQDIDRVRAAYRNFTNQKADQFDVDEERWRQSILERASNGDTTAMDEIEERAADGSLDGKTASALYRSVASELAKVGDTQWQNNPDAQEAIVGISQFIKDGGDIQEAVKKLRDIEDEYSIPQGAATKLLDQMFNTWEQTKDRLRTQTEAALKKHEASEAARASAEQALSRGYGLNDVKGTVTVAGEDGSKRELSAKDYGVMRLKTSEFENMQKAVAEGTDPDQARAVAEANIYSNLRKQSVVDEQMGNYITAALTGQIVSPTGEVNPDSAQAFEFYMRMTDNPDVGEDYMAKMVADPGARALAETARTLYAGRYNIEDSLKKAHQMMNDPNIDLNAKMAKDGMFTRTMNERISNILNTQHGRTMWSRLFGDNGFATTDIEAVQREAFREGSPLRQEIERSAQMHYVTNPRLPPEVAVKMAAQDVANNVDFVAGNIVIGNSTQNKRLSQVMGVDSLGPRAAEDAFDKMLVESGPELFGELFNTEAVSSQWYETMKRGMHAATWGVFSGEGLDYRPSAKTRYIPEYQLTYNQTNGMVGIQLYKRPDGVTVGSREQLVGPVRWFNAASIGDKYLQDTQQGKYYEPGIIQKGFRSIMEKIAGE